LDGGAQGKPRVCPICDAQVPDGSRNCPSCATDLSLFDVPLDATDVATGSKDNVDKILAELEKGEKDKALQGLKSIGTEEAAKPSTDIAGHQVIEVFQCPECGSDVPTTSNTCPKCGVMFADATAEIYQCPLCNAIIEASTAVCPGCGAIFEATEATPPPAQPAPPKPSAPAPPKTQPPKAAASTPPAPKAEPARRPEPAKAEPPVSFVERMKALRAQRDGVAPSVSTAAPPAARPSTPGQPRPQVPAQPSRPPQAGAPKSLPDMVAKIKDDFALARKVNLDIAHAKDIINRAVAAGRDKDLKTAIALVSQGEAEVERAFTVYLTKEIVSLEKQLREVQASGVDVSAIGAIVSRARTGLAGKRWAEAVSALDSARGNLTSIASEYFEAQKGLGAIKQVVDDAGVLRIDLGDGRTLYEDCLKATVRKDWDTAKMLAEQCDEHFKKILPAYIANEMRKAKTKLLEVKMMNVSITKPVGYLKDANVSIKNNNYGAALHSIRLFKEAMDAVGRG
jgi:hypothetical protein